MSAYSVFEPPRRATGARHADRFVFVRDGFGWAAFLFGPLWMLWRGLWLVLVGYVAVMTAIAAAMLAVNFPPAAVAVALLLVAFLVGTEAASLRRWTLVRRGWRDRGIVVADSLETAEHRFFAAWVTGEPRREQGRGTPPPPCASARQPPREASDVIGLFPSPGDAR